MTAPKERVRVQEKKKPRTITLLEPNQCRYPVGHDLRGRHLFCSEKTQANSHYCPHHHAVCMQKPMPRRPPPRA